MASFALCHRPRAFAGGAFDPIAFGDQFVDAEAPFFAAGRSGQRYVVTGSFADGATGKGPGPFDGKFSEGWLGA